MCVYAVTECSLDDVIKSAGIYSVCSYDLSMNIFWSYVGEYSIVQMLIEFNTLVEECIEKAKINRFKWMIRMIKRFFVMLNVVTCVRGLQREGYQS